MFLENSIINQTYTSYIFVPILIYFKYIKTKSSFFIQHGIKICTLDFRKSSYLHVQNRVYIYIYIYILRYVKNNVFSLL